MSGLWQCAIESYCCRWVVLSALRAGHIDNQLGCHWMGEKSLIDIGASPKVCCCASSVLSREVKDISGMDSEISDILFTNC
jgi:hypothetical protein